MECRLDTSEEFQALTICLLGEVKRLYKLQVLDHSPIYMRLICTKIQLIGDMLEFIYKIPQMTLQELSVRIEDLGEKEIDDTQRPVEKEMIYHRMNAYEWIFIVVRAVRLKYKL